MQSMAGGKAAVPIDTAGAEIVLDALVRALCEAGSYNRNDQAAPAALLWTDGELQWEPLMPLLRPCLPLLTLGDYAPDERTGPAYWIRCMLAGTLAEDRLPDDATPIVYLPGVSRQELRAVEECPKSLQPLAELQYRGMLWTQRNGRDWTVPAFLQSADGGLGVEVGADAATREAARRALPRLAEEPVGRLRREAPLRAAFFDALLNPDEIRRLLLWLNDPAGYRARAGADEWASFRDLCQRTYDFDPQTEGEIAAAERLGTGGGHWQTVWQRYTESPISYPAIPALLRKARPQQLGLFERSAHWPQKNEEEEGILRGKLLGLARQSPGAARSITAALEHEHGERREWVWGTLGQAPLALALAHLNVLAEETKQPIGGSRVAEIASGYATRGWNADMAVLDALAQVERPEDVAAVAAAIGALYRRWLEDAATAMQKAVGDHVDDYRASPLGPQPEGTCLLFTDGLRFDLGQRLVAGLERQDCACAVDWRLAALPTVTATAKPAVSPVAGQFAGGRDLDAALVGSRTAVNAEVLRKQLTNAGYEMLRGEETGDPSARAWTETGDIDAAGHQYGWKLAHHIAGELRLLSGRIAALLDAGWRRVVVLTDHGWLLLPDGLPKAELPEHLTEVRKGRCARLKGTSITDQQTVPWYWDDDIRIALAPGIHCYEAGRQYEHGGVSPQECVVPMITVSKRMPALSVQIESVAWRGLRCAVAVSGAVPGMIVDVRARAADAASSLCTAARSVDADGTASLLVSDEDRIGDAALVVVVAENGAVQAQLPTVVGG